MDPTSVIIFLALHLITMGGLFYLIGRRMPSRQGLGEFAAGAVVFGLAYVARLLTGLTTPLSLGGWLDAAMVVAALLFIGGLRRFVGQAAAGPRLLVAVLVCYLAANAVVTATWGPQGRHVLLNLSLGATYALMAVAAALESRRVDASLRPALRLLALLMGLLALLTTARGLLIAWQGTEVLYRGWAAQLYYAYAAVAASLLGPNLLWMVFLRLNRQLAELASRDALTRALNRNGLDDALRHHFGTRPSAPVTWLQVDVDHFKRINDEHGHAAGDAVLRAVAGVLQAQVRAGDFVARTGGEEFLVGCVGADTATAQALGERLRSGVEALATATPDGRSTVRCTVSIGVSAPFTELAQWEEAARVADKALYAAKAGGRNRVVLQLV